MMLNNLLCFGTKTWYYLFTWVKLVLKLAMKTPYNNGNDLLSATSIPFCVSNSFKACIRH